MNNIRNRTQAPKQREPRIEGLPRERFSPSTLSRHQTMPKAVVDFAQ
jgi:hypothetical protein